MVKEVFREGGRCACYTLNKDEKGRRIFLRRHPLSHFQCSKQCVDARNFLSIVTGTRYTNSASELFASNMSPKGCKYRRVVQKQWVSQKEACWEKKSEFRVFGLRWDRKYHMCNLEMPKMNSKNWSWTQGKKAMKNIVKKIPPSVTSGKKKGKIIICVSIWIKSNQEMQALANQ